MTTLTMKEEKRIDATSQTAAHGACIAVGSIASFFRLWRERMVTLGIHRTLHFMEAIFPVGLATSWSKVIYYYPGHYELLLLLGPALGLVTTRASYDRYPQLCPDDIRLYRSLPNCELSLHLAHVATPAFPLMGTAVRFVRA